MKLKSLTIKNFRQFYDENRIDFSSIDNKVTVIHGENGAGKTTLLNAFKWCLYNKTDFDKTSSDLLLNERIIAESNDDSIIEMIISIEFFYNDRVYTIKRVQKFRKVEKLEVSELDNTDISVNYINSDGSYKNETNPQSFINRIIPENMHSYFFFNGERIDKLAMIEASNEIQTAIRSMMGLQFIERSIDHLDTVIKSLKKDMANCNDTNLESLGAQLNELEENLKNSEEHLKLVTHNILSFKEEKKIISDRLKEMQEVSILENERQDIEKSLKEINELILNSNRNQIELISSKGFHAFSDSFLDPVEKILEDKRTKGEIPSKFKSQFIEDLLADKKCFCGRPLVPGEEHYEYVKSLLAISNSSETEDAFNTAYSVIKPMRDLNNNIHNEFDNISDQLAIFYESRNEKHKRLDEISHLIRSNTSEDIVDLEEKHQIIENKLDEVKLKKGLLERDIENMSNQHKDLSKDMDSLSTQNEEAAQIRANYKFAQETKRVITDLYEAITNNVRIGLSQKVDDTFKSIIKKDYWAEISEDFVLKIYKMVGEHKQEVVHKSTGENQVTSLCFISSLINICKENSANKKEFAQGGTFPIVMDSAFGALDPEYRRYVARMIPSLAEQVVFMVSDSQWSLEVKEEIQPLIGYEYTIEYFDPAKDQTIKYEYSQIKECNNG